MRGQRNPDADIDLGLAVSALSLQRGQTRSASELAAFCGVRHGTIQFIEKKAIKKMRKRLIALGVRH
jgi:DNA-directed RNA polymerase specialized sigma24 family protein